MILLRHRLVIGLIEAIASVSLRSKALRSVTLIIQKLKQSYKLLGNIVLLVWF